MNEQDLQKYITDYVQPLEQKLTGLEKKVEDLTTSLAQLELRLSELEGWQEVDAETTIEVESTLDADTDKELIQDAETALLNHLLNQSPIETISQKQTPHVSFTIDLSNKKN